MIPLFKQRRSIRQYGERKLTKSEIELLIKAQQIAPTSMNKRPVELVVIEERDVITALADCKAHGTVGLQTAPAVFVVMGNSEISDVWVEDASIAATFIQLQVEQMNLGSCWIQLRNRTDKEGTCSEQRVRELLAIPEQYGILCLLTVGEKAQWPEPLDEPVITGEKVHYKRFGE